MEPPSSSTDLVCRKLFVGGISSQTGEETLAEHFARYGEVQEVAVIRDRVTGSGRGFGFVQFSDPGAAKRALEEDQKHVICGRTVEVKRATVRNELPQKQQYQNSSMSEGSSRSTWSNCSSENNNDSSTNSKKIFVGGLPDNVTDHELKSYFDKFGSVVDTVVMFDNVTLRPRGFGFVTFSSEEPVAMVLKNCHHELNGKLVEVKIAIPKDERNNRFNRVNGYYHDGKSIDGGGSRMPLYGPHQSYLYPSYGPYGYYGYANNVAPAPPFSPYFYDGVYNPNGVHGVQYGGLIWIPRPWHHPKRMLNSSSYPQYFKRGFASSMSVTADDIPQGHGSSDSDENQGNSSLQTIVRSMTELHVAEDGKCNSN